MTIQSKLELINKTFKAHTVNESFMVMKDKQGWTDGYMAYFLEDIKYEKAFLRAREKNEKGKMYRFIDKKENAPTVSNIINLGGEWKEITDIQLSFTEYEVGILVELIAGEKEIRALVNPSFLVYFNDPDLVYKIKAEFDPIQVFKNGELIGLIMPVRLR